MDTAETGTLIIGAGEAGLGIAVALRNAGYTAPVTISGSEADAPYQRPPLSKEFLAGEMDEENLLLRANNFYQDKEIRLLTNAHIEDIVLDDNAAGGTATTSSGTEIRFDRLALATGASPRRLPVPGADLDGVCYLRDIPDARRLRGLLPEARRVVVVGGGYIGLEAAAVARTRGLEVTVVETFERLLQRVAAPPISEFFRAAHEKRGARVLLGASVTALQGSAGSVTGVELSDGTVLPADLVIIGIGVEPRIELAQKLGLDCGRGIIVDDAARTSNPAIVAAGDCTMQPHPLYPGELICLESVQNAADQAKVAAASLLDGPRPERAVPWFWSNQADIRLQIAGLSAGFDDYVIRGEPGSEQFTVLYYRGGRLIAADAVNSPHDFMAVKRALGKGATIDPADAANVGVQLKTLIRET
ncbi:FAD-dependent oxidoreductase [Arthrobacter sp. I2-34]|uniref:FAD-dependent oxidoreductase n=1 Tax=Arthrobacter hankyongi TaxID=2904801 RepID=A0ABS9L7V5_9MICC|nr:FAD-dependent oxidoreductase [Arthrobacter hankyongi]MCG2622593.1 FAD-dependent oxidoreductase [Arthrobacter hankyongi]